MANCCSYFDMKSLCEDFNVKIEQTKTGINVNIEPKDQSKIESFKNLVKACQDFCDCQC